MPDPFAEMALEQVQTGTLGRILATTDGTIATILEAYTGEPVEVLKLSEAFEAGDSQSPELPIEAGEKLLRRSVLLQGLHSRTSFLYADCIIRADRLPPAVLEELLSTTTPLRRVFSNHRIGTFEEMVDCGREAAGDCAVHFGVAPDARLVSRRYRLLTSGEPVILISEKFPVDAG